MPANHECCITSLTLYGLWAGSFAKSREIKSHRNISLVLLPGIRISRRSGWFSKAKIKNMSKQHVKSCDVVYTKFRYRFLVDSLTKNTSNCVSTVSLQVKEGWDAHHKFVEQTSEGPQVRLTTVLLLDEELRWTILQSSEEGCCRDTGAFFLGSHARWRNWRWGGGVISNWGRTLLKIAWGRQRKAKIAQFCVPVWVDEHILWF